MRQDTRAATMMMLGLAMAASFASAPGVAAQAPAAQSSSPAPSAPGGPYTSVKACASCHRLIHQYWSESAHARSATTPAYLAGLEAVVAAASDKQAARVDCVWCHAPTVLVTGDYELKQPVTREGVSCDFCHTVKGVDLARAGRPFELSPGNVKRGPLQYAKSKFHDTEYSPLHKASPLLCASCHEYRNAQGVSVLSTYTEWRQTSYAARGVTCQECHMPVVPGTTVPASMKPSDHVINLHRIVGGSNPSKLSVGLDLKIESVTHTSGAADVQVVVTSSRVGHSAPGGFANRALVLAVGVEGASGELLHRREMIYRRALKDAEGRELVTVADLMLKAAAEGEDTRIRPGESRAERFTVPIPEGARAIVARLEYRDLSDPKAGPRTILVNEERRDLTLR
jgi:Cytochrome c554 and c-prime